MAAARELAVGLERGQVEALGKLSHEAEVPPHVSVRGVQEVVARIVVKGKRVVVPIHVEQVLPPCEGLPYPAAVSANATKVIGVGDDDLPPTCGRAIAQRSFGGD